MRSLSSLVLFILVVAPACEVSVFGSEPIQLGGGPGPTAGGEAGRCGEPEEARRVRERLAETGDADPCAFRCVLEAGVLRADAETRCDLVSVAEDGVLALDMSEADALVARVSICQDTVLHLADSRGARHDGGDDPTSSHDASVLVSRGNLDLLPAHGGELGASHVEGFVPRTTDAGCVMRTFEITDSVVYLASLERGLCGGSMLRIDPPTDEQGRPDSVWYLALGRSLDDAIGGAPPPRAELCFF